MKAYPTQRGVEKGLSALELLMVVAVVGILSAVAYPAVYELILSSRTRALAFQITTHLALARNAAITRGQRVAVSPIAGPWQDGWRVHLDPNANGVWDEGEELLAWHHGESSAEIRANGAMQRYVLFEPSGRPVQRSGGFLSGSIVICARSGSAGTALVMNASGRVRTDRRADLC
jgi:type IV fimbrial biogenesis protein FimT